MFSFNRPRLHQLLSGFASICLLGFCLLVSACSDSSSRFCQWAGDCPSGRECTGGICIEKEVSPKAKERQMLVVSPCPGTKEVPKATLLASKQYSLYLAQDNEAVYWTSYRSGKEGGGKAAVSRVRKSLLQVNSLGHSPSGAMGVAVDATHVYWVTRGGKLFRVPKSGGNPELVHSEKNGEFHAIALDATHVYWTQRGSTQWMVKSLSKKGGVLTTIAKETGFIALAVDSQAVYFSWQKQLVKYDKVSGKIKVLHRLNPRELVLDDNHVYWGVAVSEYSRALRIFKMSKRGENPRLLASHSSLVHMTSEPSVSPVGFSHLFVDKEHLYYRDNDECMAPWAKEGECGKEGLFRIKKDGTQPTKILHQLDTYITGIIVDERFIFWMSNDGSLKRLKRCGWKP